MNGFFRASCAVRVRCANRFARNGTSGFLPQLEANTKSRGWTHAQWRHCEERSEEAIQTFGMSDGLLRFARNDVSCMGSRQWDLIWGFRSGLLWSLMLFHFGTVFWLCAGELGPSAKARGRDGCWFTALFSISRAARIFVLRLA